MTSEYTDSSYLPCLCVDAGSPITSVAVETSAGRVFERSTRERRSSGQLLSLVAEVLDSAGLQPADLQSVVGLRGPGSFTGLRVTAATLMGLQEALDIRATALETLDVLGSLRPEDCEHALAVVDALRGEWFWQRDSRHPGGSSSPNTVSSPAAAETLPIEPGVLVIGHGVEKLSSILGPQACAYLEAGALAPVALRMIRRKPPTWDADLLAKPLYLRSAPPPPNRSQR